MNKTRSWKLWTIRGVSQLICGIPLAIVVFYFFGLFWGLGAYILGALVGSMPIDRFMDERYRQLEPLDD
jgi:hypothetical protein